MRIQVTMNEVKQLIADTYKLPPTIEIVIIEASVNSDLLNFIKLIRGYKYSTDQKVLAIKALREFASEQKHPYGLSEAKWAIEHFNEWVSIVEQKNRLPIMQCIEPCVYAMK